MEASIKIIKVNTTIKIRGINIFLSLLTRIKWLSNASIMYSILTALLEESIGYPSLDVG